MTDTTSTTPDTTAVDEAARFRALTALGLSLAALMGGGVVSNALQWVMLDRLEITSGDNAYAFAVLAGPLLLAAAALALATGATSSADTLARPLGRAGQALAVVALLGTALLGVGLVVGL